MKRRNLLKTASVFTSNLTHLLLHVISKHSPHRMNTYIRSDAPLLRFRVTGLFSLIFEGENRHSLRPTGLLPHSRQSQLLVLVHVIDDAKAGINPATTTGCSKGYVIDVKG